MEPQAQPPPPLAPDKMAYDPTDFNSVELKISHFAGDKDNHPAHYNICSDLRVFLSIKIGEVETLKRNGAPTEAKPHLINVKYIPTRSAFVVTAPTTYSDTIFQAGAFDFEAYRLVCQEHDISRVQGRRKDLLRATATGAAVV